jgi:hypothetical protein
MPRVIVEVRGGVVQEIYADDPSIEVVLLDWDTEGCDPAHDGLAKVDDDLVRAVIFPASPTTEMPPDTADAVRQAT